LTTEYQLIVLFTHCNLNLPVQLYGKGGGFSERNINRCHRRSQVKCRILQNQDHFSFFFTLNINPYCSCKKGEIGVESGGGRLAVESVGGNGGWKKMGRGYKIGAKDFGLKTKGRAVRAYSGWGRLFSSVCTALTNRYLLIRVNPFLRGSFQELATIFCW